MKLRLLLPLLAAGVLAALSTAADRYPKVNVAVGYEVDPTWPKKPEGMSFGMTPGIAVDAKDRVYVFTRSEPPVQVYEADGTFVRSWGQGVIKGAHHLRIDHEGNVWVADIVRHVIEKYTPEGKRLLTLGTPDHEGCDATHMNMPTDMAITKTGDVFVSDGYGNARVVHFDRMGKFVKDWGKLGTKPGEFSAPHSIALDSKGRLYVADRNNARIQIFDQSGKVLDVWDNVIVPWGLCMMPNDELWVCGSSPGQWRKTDEMLGVPPKDQLLLKFNTAGRLLQLWSVPKGVDGLERPGELNWVHCIAADSKGNLYAGDIKGKRAQKFVRKEP